MFCALFYSRFYFANNSRTSDTTHDQKLGVVVLTRLGRIYILATIYFQDLTSTNNIKNKELLTTNEQITNDKLRTYLHKSCK